MNEPCRIVVLVKGRLAGKLASALTENGLEIIPPEAAQQPGFPCDIVVLDQEVHGQLSEKLQRLISHGLVGLIRLGTSGGGDVVLPEDWTSRELILACKLLHQTILLRRQLFEQRRRQRLLRDLAYRDPVTGLANRRGWQREVNYVATSSCVGSILIAILDIDYFKQINDRFGMVEGDRVLKAVGHALSRALRRDDFAARLGGDEFAFCLTDVNDAESARKLVERVRLAAQQAAPTDFHQPVTLSAGWAMGQSQDFVQLFVVADQALRRAKQLGRNQTCP